MTTPRQLREIAARTGLDAVAELLRDAADEIERLQACGQELERAVAKEREAINDEWARRVSRDLESSVHVLNKAVTRAWRESYPAMAGFAAAIRARGAQGESNAT